MVALLHTASFLNSFRERCKPCGTFCRNWSEGYYLCRDLKKYEKSVERSVLDQFTLPDSDLGYYGDSAQYNTDTACVVHVISQISNFTILPVCLGVFLFSFQSCFCCWFSEPWPMISSVWYWIQPLHLLEVVYTPVHIGKMDADVAQRMKFYGSVEVILAGFVHLICL
jgi:hypothetical protein